MFMCFIFISCLCCCFQLIEGVEVCVICGPKPTLQDAETKVHYKAHFKLNSVLSVSSYYFIHLI